MTCMPLSVFGKSFDMNVWSLKTSHKTHCVRYTTIRVPCRTDLISHLPHGRLKALTHYKDFHKDFSKKSLGKSLPIYKPVEKIFAVVKKSCIVYGR